MHKNWKNAVITGATSGIGEEFARSLSHQTNLYLIGRDEEKGKKLETALTSTKRSVMFLRCDLSNDEDIYELLSLLKDVPVDLLIHAAGEGYFGEIKNHSAHDEEKLLKVNALAPCVVTRGLLNNILNAQKNDSDCQPAIIYISSIVAFMPMPRLTTYSASKSFLLHYAEGLSAELGDQAMVLAICPGSVKTEFAKRAGLNPRLVEDAPSPTTVVEETFKYLGKKTVHIIGRNNFKRSLWPRFYSRKRVLEKTNELVKKAIALSENY